MTAELLAVFRAGNLSRVGTLQNRLAKLDKEIVARGPAAIKAAMDVVGLYGGPVRDPLAPLAAQDRERIGQLFAA
jgi:dihydrodipicolinate synthase/N-acetylneuraminate lyase